MALVKYNIFKLRRTKKLNQNVIAVYGLNKDSTSIECFAGRPQPDSSSSDIRNISVLSELSKGKYPPWSSNLI
jgi:hypothetical protein